MDSTLPEIRVHQPQTEPAPEPESAAAASAAPEHSVVRRYLLARGNSAIADRVFKVSWCFARSASSASWSLIAYRTGATSSQLSWAQFGLQVLLHRPIIDPDHQTALIIGIRSTATSAHLPFIYGTLVSSFLGAADCGSAGPRRGRLPHRDVPRLPARPAGLPHRAAGRHSQHHLRPVGVLRPRSAAARVRQSRAHQSARLDRLLHRRQPHRPRLFSCRRHSRHHDSAHHLFAHPRGDDRRAPLAARSRAGSRRHALGDDSHGRAAQCAHRHRRRHHSRPGPRPGRNHGRHHGHRQHARDPQIASRQRRLHGLRHRQRIC